MIEVNGDIHPWERGRGARRSVTWTATRDRSSSQMGLGAGGRPSLFRGLALYVRL